MTEFPHPVFFEVTAQTELDCGHEIQVSRKVGSGENCGEFMAKTEDKLSLAIEAHACEPPSVKPTQF